MARSVQRPAILFTLACLFALPRTTHAQSAIGGVVRDSSGAVLPGVTVEASSDVLIERARSVVTDGQGQYRIVDLRPGVYTVTFTLVGFQVFRRNGVELPGNFTATINAEMRVGGIEESVTVSGQSPVVDVQSAARITVLTRDTLDAIPTGRTIQGLGQLVVGVTLNVPDVGGSRAMQQTYMSVHGLSSSQVTTQVDGMMVNGLDGDGAVQNYFNNMMSQEMAYQTAGAGTDVSGGGVRLNMIPKEGGNRFSGAFFGAWSDGAWQSDNLTQSLKDRGLSAPDKISKIYDFNASVGGPVKKDRVWVFASARRWGVDAPIADTFYTPAGSNYSKTYPQCKSGTIQCEQGIDDQHIKSALVRLTWQVSPRNKMGMYYDRVGKDRGHGMNAGDDPATASQIWTSPNYSTGSVKWTSTSSSRLLIEGGYSFNIERYNIVNQPGIDQQPGTAAWYAGASRRDLNLGTHYASLDQNLGQYPDRYNLQGSASYVTGSHNVKAGAQWNWGPYRRTRVGNADLIQRYRNGLPDSVAVYNTPIEWTDRLNADLGIFAQDAVTLKRLTVNVGARWEYFNSEVSASTSPPGRFVPTRSFDTIPMPVWTDLAPRFGVVYDLFGDAKTAIKAGINRYELAQTINFADQFNPLVLTSANLSWTDLNQDDVAQGELGCVYLTTGCEINFAQMPQNFGVRPLVSPNPDIKRVYNVETTVGVQHELLSGVQLNASWFHRTFHNLPRQTNTLQSFSDYTLVTVVSPLDGSLIPMNNVSRAALTRILMSRNVIRRIIRAGIPPPPPLRVSQEVVTMNASLIAIVTVALSAPLTAQWLNHPTPGIPRSPDGKPNLTAPVPRTVDGKPDLSGLWTRISPKYARNIAADLKPEEIQSWAHALVEQRREDLGREYMNVKCVPLGPGYATSADITGAEMMKIVQTPGLIVILNPDLTYRQIFLDGRSLESAPNPAWMGYSVGNWDGDTLVVESSGFNDRTWLDHDGHPHTEALRMTERYRRRDFGNLELEVTFSDPAAYARPWTVAVRAELAADTEMIEFVCNESSHGVEHWVGKASDEQKNEVQVAPEILAKYAGIYEEQAPLWRAVPRVVEITLLNDRLLADMDGRGKVRLIATSETAFSGLYGLGVEFIQTGSGGLFVKHVSGNYRFARR